MTSVLLFACLASASDLAAQTAAPTGAANPSSAAAPAAAKSPGLPAVSATLILRTPLSSKNASQGKEIKAILSQAVTLPTGEVIPRGTVVTGKVLQSSARSKQRPNGAIDLVFNEVQMKDKPPIPIAVRLRALAQSVASETERIALPNTDYIGGTSNSGGQDKLLFETSDQNAITTNFKASGIKGVYLEGSPRGSGIILAVGDELYLDTDMRIIVVLARAAQAPAPTPPANP